jgi:hypothetical protein
MALDPNIALSVRPLQLEMPNQLAQYAQISQIQNAQQANRLHEMQMAEYERARLEEEGTRNFLGKADLTDPTVRTQLLTGYGKTGREIYKNLSEAEKAQSEDSARRLKLMQDTQNMYRDMSGIISNKTDAAAFLQRVVNDPLMKDSPIAKIPLMQQVARIPEDPQGLDDWKKQFALGATKYITENKPVTFAQDTGAGGRLMTRPGLGGEATVVPGSQFTKTPTFADTNAAARLAFEQNKFAWEKANPGFELKEAEDGSIVGVNKRTLQAFPVSIGGTTPAATPMANAGMPGARLPAPAVQAIPGMNSVLDQQVPAAAPTAGKPLMGKGTSLTESQGNAAAYGMRMKEADSILEQMAKEGTLRGANIEAVPFVGEGLGKILPSFLGGTNAAQQQVNQAKANFVTAVLRKESGASISDAEFAREDKKYFPQVGDDEKTIKQKADARKLAIKAMELQAGPGAKNIQQYQPTVGGGLSGATANDPLGLGIR